MREGVPPEQEAFGVPGRWILGLGGEAVVDFPRPLLRGEEVEGRRWEEVVPEKKDLRFVFEEGPCCDLKN